MIFRGTVVPKVKKRTVVHKKNYIEKNTPAGGAATAELTSTSAWEAPTPSTTSLASCSFPPAASTDPAISCDSEATVSGAVKKDFHSGMVFFNGCMAITIHNKDLEGVQLPYTRAAGKRRCA
jgi:hypothetical protein